MLPFCVLNTAHPYSKGLDMPLFFSLLLYKSCRFFADIFQLPLLFLTDLATLLKLAKDFHKYILSHRILFLQREMGYVAPIQYIIYTFLSGHF